VRPKPVPELDPLNPSIILTEADPSRSAFAILPGAARGNRGKARIPAIAYLRTSSAANVGGDKDSDKRQRDAIEGFARRAGFELAGEFYDAAVSGKDPIEGRPGFKALLERAVGNGVRVVIVEDTSRFARHLLTQEAGISLLVGLGVRVMTAAGDDLTDSDDEFRVAMPDHGRVLAAREDPVRQEAEDRSRSQARRRQGRGPQRSPQRAGPALQPQERPEHDHGCARSTMNLQFELLPW
jgi:DNA invertase Pin-like site-specific DNA recombinase